MLTVLVIGDSVFFTISMSPAPIYLGRWHIMVIVSTRSVVKFGCLSVCVSVCVFWLRKPMIRYSF